MAETALTPARLNADQACELMATAIACALGKVMPAVRSQAAAL